MFTIEQTVDEVFALYEKYGQADYIGEAISQVEHASQCAQLARKQGYDDEVILAAFFHDIGHLCEMDQKQMHMGNHGVVSHEKLGADYLRKREFSEKVAKLTENHVEAKRYLTFKDKSYNDKLSDASKKTLEYQGGPMNEQEAKAFEDSALFEVSIKMREWDEQAKEVGAPLIDFNKLKEKCSKHLSKQQSSNETMRP